MPDTKASADPSVTVANVADADSLLGLFASATSTNGRFTLANLKAYLLAGLAVFGASGASAAKGFVPSPGATAGTTRFLREDATWAPAGPKNNYAASAPPTTTDDASQGYDTGSSWLNPGTGDMWRCRSPVAGAARWVKLDAADHSGYVLGRFYAPFGVGAPVGGSAQTAGSMFLSFGVIKQRITVSQIQARLTTASSGGNVQLAIYNHDPATGKASTLVASTASGSTTTADRLNLAVTPGNVTLEPGNYWFASMADNSVAALLGLGPTSTNHLSLVGSASGLGISATTQPCGIGVSGLTFGTWPGDISGMTQTELVVARAPVVMLLVASVP